MKIAWIVFPLLLAGCAAEEHQDLREWMREEAKGLKGKVTPLPEVSAFPVVAYETGTMTSPFSVNKIVTLDLGADKSSPERARPPQPLEAFPIEDLRVMGIIVAGSVPYALIQTPPPNKPKHVRVGEYMGKNLGKVTSITPEGLTITETIKDANGSWVTQERQLPVPKGGL